MAQLTAPFDPAAWPDEPGPYVGLPPFPAILELQQRRQWVAWRSEIRDGRPTKVPINPKGGFAKSNAPSTWGAFGEVDRLVARSAGGLAGVGFMLSVDDDYTGVDLDKVVDEQGDLLPWVREIIAYGETYTEISPSGRGVRMFVRGKITAAVKSAAAGVELYATGRYLTVTGSHIPGTPEDIRPAPRTLAALIARVEALKPPPVTGPIELAAPRAPAASPGGSEFFRRVNDLALQALSAWVPNIFPTARLHDGTGSWRVSSRDLGRALQEDLSLAPSGIVDFGVADMGDPQEGKRTPLDIVIQYGPTGDIQAAAHWLCGRLGRDPVSLGWEDRERLAADGAGIVAGLLAGRTADGTRYDPPTGEIAAPAETPSLLPILDPTTLQGQPVPTRQWLVADMIPANNVTLLSGDGGSGKSLLSLQLAVAVATHGVWLGHRAPRGRALFLTAEDDLEECHRRLYDITYAEGLQFQDLSALRIAPMAGMDAILAAPDGRSSALRPTILWRALLAYVGEFQPSLIVLDTLADLFGGNEIDRGQVRAFVGLLRGLALRGITVVLLSHPSVSGMSSGSGISGSTAWNNSVRSRLYLRRAVSEDGTENDPDLRIIATKKANYGRAGSEARMRWQDGRFVSEDGPAMSFTGGVEGERMRVEEQFLAMLDRYEASGRTVNAAGGKMYAPLIFSMDDTADGTSKKSFTAAMNRLFDAKRIQLVEYGPPSTKRNRIARVSDWDVK